MPAPTDAALVRSNRKVKLSTYLDQSDDTEFDPASREVVQRWYDNWRAFAKGPPDPEEEPSAEQLSALHVRVYTQASTPYVDFAVWGPLNRRMARSLRFKSWIPQADGSFLAKEVPGPPTLMIWEASYRVFRCAAVMLGILSEAPLAAYASTISRLAAHWPTCWHLVATADDRCRAEHLERLRRQVVYDTSRGLPPPPLWAEKSPWDACLLLAARDREFWNTQVRDIAVAWLAHGRRGSPPDSEEAAAEDRIAGGAAALRVPAERPRGASTAAKAAAHAPARPARRRPRPKRAAGAAAKATSGKRKFTTDAHGKALCFFSTIAVESAGPPQRAPRVRAGASMRAFTAGVLTRSPNARRDPRARVPDRRSVRESWRPPPCSRHWRPHRYPPSGPPRGRRVRLRRRRGRQEPRRHISRRSGRPTLRGRRASPHAAFGPYPCRHLAGAAAVAGACSSFAVCPGRAPRSPSARHAFARPWTQQGLPHTHSRMRASAACAAPPAPSPAARAGAAWEPQSAWPSLTPPLSSRSWARSASAGATKPM